MFDHFQNIFGLVKIQVVVISMWTPQKSTWTFGTPCIYTNTTESAYLSIPWVFCSRTDLIFIFILVIRFFQTSTNHSFAYPKPNYIFGGRCPRESTTRAWSRRWLAWRHIWTVSTSVPKNNAPKNFVTMWRVPANHFIPPTKRPTPGPKRTTKVATLVVALSCRFWT